MERYYVNENAQPNGDHEVHKESCTHEPLPRNRRQLGYQTSCASAVIEAKKVYQKSNGCYWCCAECHTS